MKSSNGCFIAVLAVLLLMGLAAWEGSREATGQIKAQATQVAQAQDVIKVQAKAIDEQAQASGKAAEALKTNSETIAQLAAEQIEAAKRQQQANEKSLINYQITLFVIVLWASFLVVILIGVIIKMSTNKKEKAL